MDMINKDDIEAFKPEQLDAVLGGRGSDMKHSEALRRGSDDTVRPDTASLRGAPDVDAAVQNFMAGAIYNWIKAHRKYRDRVDCVSAFLDRKGHVDHARYNPLTRSVVVVLGIGFGERLMDIADNVFEAIIPKTPPCRAHDSEGIRNQQIYAYTEPTPPAGYAQFLQVFNHVGWTTVVIRDRDSTEHFIRIPTAEFIKLQNVNAYGRIGE